LGKSSKRALKILTNSVKDVEQQGLKAPLLWGHGVVRLAKASHWLGVGSFSVGVVGNLKRRSKGDIVGCPCWSMVEVISCDGSRGCEWEGRVTRGKKQRSRKGAQATEAIDGERDQSDAVGVQGLDD
jgi:hypothetical protein